MIGLAWDSFRELSFDGLDVSIDTLNSCCDLLLEFLSKFTTIVGDHTFSWDSFGAPDIRPYHLDQISANARVLKSSLKCLGFLFLLKISLSHVRFVNHDSW